MVFLWKRSKRLSNERISIWKFYFTLQSFKNFHDKRTWQFSPSVSPLFELPVSWHLSRRMDLWRRQFSLSQVSMIIRCWGGKGRLLVCRGFDSRLEQFDFPDKMFENVSSAGRGLDKLYQVGPTGWFESSVWSGWFRIFDDAMWCDGEGVQFLERDADAQVLKKIVINCIAL